MLVFATPLTLESLRSSHIWLADGTFHVALQLFHQLHTIHALKNGFTVPCIFARLANKTEPTYNNLWDSVAEEIGLADMQEKPVVLLDFENATYKAANHVGDHNLGGCYFHFSQAVLRRVQARLFRV